MSYTPPPPPPPPGQGGYGYAAPQTNQKAMWSMILGILSLLCCGIVLGVVAIVLGNMGRREIAESGGMQSGEGMAKAGVILGIVGIVLNVLVGIIYLSVGFGSNTGL